MKTYIIKFDDDILGIIVAKNKKHAIDIIWKLEIETTSKTTRLTKKDIPNFYEIEETTNLTPMFSDKDLDEIIEAVVEELDFTVEVVGYHDYDVTPEWTDKGKDAIRKKLKDMFPTK
jgi:hypothetical protein